MSPAILHLANYTACVDYVADPDSAGPNVEYFRLEGSTFTEGNRDFDSASVPILIHTTSASVINTQFPLGQAHPSFPNLLLTSRGELKPWYGGWSDITLNYTGIAFGALSSGVRVYKSVERASPNEKTYPVVGGVSLRNVPGFTAATEGWPTRVRHFDYGYSIWFIANSRLNLPSTDSTVTQPLAGSFPTIPPTPWAFIAAPTRIYPYGWSVASHEQEQIPNTNYHLGQIHYGYEYQYQPS